MAFTLERVKPEALEVGDIIHVEPYDLKIAHIRLDKSIRGEPDSLLLRPARGERHASTSR